MAQFARPNNDKSITSYQDQGGGTTNIYQSIDEVSPSDSDYVFNKLVTDPESYSADYSNLTDPGVDTGHIWRFRHKITNSFGSGTVYVTLRQGTSPWIKTFTYTSSVGSITTVTHNLTTGEASNITDYTDLNIRVLVSDSFGATTAQLYWTELEIPDAAVSFTPKIMIF